MALINLGNILMAQEKMDEAILSYRKAIEIDPKSDRARNFLAVVLGKRGWDLANCPDPKLRSQQAADAANEAVGIAPGSSSRGSIWDGSSTGRETGRTASRPLRSLASSRREEWAITPASGW